MTYTTYSPEMILEQCLQLKPSDLAYSECELIQRFGSPEQPIYVDQGIVDINGIKFKDPLIIPILNGESEHIQYAVIQSGKPVLVLPDGQPKGSIQYGEFMHEKPILITFSLEACFKLTRAGYAVALVVLPTLCNNNLTELKPSTFKQIEFVINQLSKAGYKQLYMPLRPEDIVRDEFKRLEQNTTVRLINQYQKVGENHFLLELTQDESDEEVTIFLDEAIARLLSINLLPKGHLAKPIKWGNGYFHILEDGIFFVEIDKNGNESKLFISSPILVIAKTRDDSSNNWGVLLEWLDDNGIKHIQAISMELFQTDGADLRKALAYQGVTISTSNRGRILFLEYLANSPTKKRALCIDHVGWHKEAFVLPHMQFGQRADGDMMVYQATHGLDNRYQSKGALVEWRNNIALLVQNHSLLVFALSTAFSGQLLDELNQQGGGFHIKGGSSKGKSTALNLACSVWGNPKQFYRTWRATGNAIENTAHMHNDSFLVLDEIGEIANPKEIGNIVYMLANGTGKARMTKQITAKPIARWNIVFLSSGEKSLKEIMQEQGQKIKLGQEIRLVDIDIDQNQYGIFDCLDFALDGATQSSVLINRIGNCYGIAGIAWLEYLTSDKKRAVSDANELFNRYRKALSTNHSQGHILRVADYFALVATAGELAGKANITGWVTGTAFKAAQKIFNQWLRNFEQVGNYEAKEILAHVKLFFEANESSRFESITPDPDHIERIINRVGYWRIENGEKVFYVTTEQFKNEVCKGYKHLEVANVLLRYGLLEHDSNRTSKGIRLPNNKKTVRVYAIKESILSIDLDNI